MPRLLLALLLIAGAGRVFACSCIQMGDAVSAVADTEAVFVGKVLATEMVLVGKDVLLFAAEGADLSATTGTLKRITVVQVAERWKGDLAPFVILVGASGGGDCGYFFETGKSYLIYAERSADPLLRKMAGTSPAWTTGLCTFNAKVEEAAEALAQIRRKYRSTRPVFIAE